MRRLLAVMLVGCGGKEEPVDVCPDAVVELAHHEGVSVPEGGEVEFVFGSQGGFHSQIGAWVRTEDTAVALLVTVTDLDGGLVAQSSQLPSYVMLAEKQSCEGWAVTTTYLGGTPQIDVATACAYDGQEVMIEVEATPLAQLDSTEEPLVLSIPAWIRVSASVCE